MVDLAELSAATNLAFDTTKVHSVRLRDNGRARVVVPSEESSTGAFEVVYDAELGSWLRAKEVTAELVGRTIGRRALMLAGKRVPLLGGAVGAGADGFGTWQVGRYAQAELKDRRIRRS